MSDKIFHSKIAGDVTELIIRDPVFGQGTGNRFGQRPVRRDIPHQGKPDLVPFSLMDGGDPISAVGAVRRWDGLGNSLIRDLRQIEFGNRVDLRHGDALHEKSA